MLTDNASLTFFRQCIVYFLARTDRQRIVDIGGGKGCLAWKIGKPGSPDLPEARPFARAENPPILGESYGAADRAQSWNSPLLMTDRSATRGVRPPVSLSKSGGRRCPSSKRYVDGSP
jgi:hypothetical protein